MIDVKPLRCNLTIYPASTGVWTAIGTDAVLRHKFYEAANWCYQAGVFISRSSGMVYQASRRVLWIMPAAQIGLLMFFIAVAAVPVVSLWLILPAFFAGNRPLFISRNFRNCLFLCL